MNGVVMEKESTMNNSIDNAKSVFDISDIKDMYIADMQKYVKNSIETVKIEKVYKSIPSQLAKENKNFKYNFIEENGRKRKYESSIDWLVASKMILIDYNTKKIEIPYDSPKDLERILEILGIRIEGL